MQTAMQVGVGLIILCSIAGLFMAWHAWSDSQAIEPTPEPVQTPTHAAILAQTEEKVNAMPTMETGLKMPVGRWLLVDPSKTTPFPAFTYVDGMQGFSAQGDAVEDGKPVRMILRLPMKGLSWRAMTPEEGKQHGLPAVPTWLAAYGPQPAAGTVWGTWYDHPRLQGKFHPDYPDDLQVIVHDGGPRITQARPELIWVRITGGSGDLFSGQVLNKPTQLKTVSAYQEIKFIVPGGGAHPLMVTDKYLKERAEWEIRPCSKCGLTELFDAPSDLIRVVFPNVDLEKGDRLESFTAFCGACHGVQLVKWAPHSAPSQP
ncbi:MAG: hypothetical protein KIS92_13830 [Planctomycetota bacterium]|nr:hypothetical protein [Planctomycetota bacterium]